MTRMLRPPTTGIGRVAIADASGLLFSDDYRAGWLAGFTSAGVEVKVFDVGILSKIPRNAAGPYSIQAASRTTKMVADQILHWNPDLVWCHHGRYQGLHPFLDQFKRRGIRTACYLCDEPYECGESVQYSKLYDYVFTIDPSTLHLHKIAKKSHDTVFYLPPGVDTGHFKLIEYRDRGTTRRPLLAKALFLGNATLHPRPTYFRAVEAAIGEDATIRYWRSTHKGHKEWIPFSDHPQWYGSCILGLNVHRSPRITEKEYTTRIKNRGSRRGPDLPGMPVMTAPPPEWGTGFWNDYDLPAQHVNPRFFEFAACGTCVISDNSRTELRRMFPWTPRADTPERFVELVMYYLSNRDEARVIGEACLREVLKRHTYHHRAAEVLTRVGLRASMPVSAYSSLGEPKEWLTPQDFPPSGEHPSLEQTGRFATFDPPIGMSLIFPSGSPKSDGSLAMDLPWSS